METISEEERKRIEDEAIEVCHIKERYKSYENVEGGGCFFAFIDGAEYEHIQFLSRESSLRMDLGISEIGNNQKQRLIDVANGYISSLESKVQELEQQNKELREVLIFIKQMLELDECYPKTIEKIDKLLTP